MTRKIIINAKIDLIPALIDIYKEFKEYSNFDTGRGKLLQLIKDLEKE